MAPIYYAVKVVAAVWIIMVIFILFFGGNKSEKQDRSSKIFIILTISFVLPIIQYTVASGTAAPGAFSWGFPIISYLGFFLFAFGLCIHITGIYTLNKHWSAVVVIKQDHQLVETGIYKTIRHPIYAGLLLEFLGFGLALSNWITILVLVLPNAASLAYRIHVEERALAAHFGDAYTQYARKTSRLIPGIF
jgi:protein-S-isoprenylcysteine O-methyltransferase Ste14